MGLLWNSLTHINMSEDRAFTHTSIEPDEKKSADIQKAEDVSKSAVETKHTSSAKKTKKKKTTKKKTKKKPTKKDHITDQLAEIYKEQDGSLPDMGHFETKQRRRFARALVTLVLSIAVLSGVAWAGFFIFVPPTSFSEADIIVSISGDEEIQAGQDVRYRVRYRNAQRLALSNVRLQVRYPDGFVFAESSVEPEEDSIDTWFLGDIAGGDSGFIDISGSLYGDIQEEQSLRAFFTYIPENFSSEFQKVATVRVAVTDAPISLQVDAPDKARAGVSVPLNILVERPEDIPQTGATAFAIEIDAGATFVKQEESIEATAFEDYRWDIPSLDEPFPLQVKGIFSGSGEVTLPVRILGWQEGKHLRDDAFVLAEKEVTVVLEDSGVEIRPVVNGATGALDVSPGEPLSTSIVVRNTSDTSLKDVRVRAIFDAPSHNNRSILHWADINDPADGDIVGEQLSSDTRRGYIRWSSRQVPALADIEPGQEVVIDVTLPIKSDEEASLASFQTHRVDFSADMQFNTESGTEIVSSEPVIMTVQSDLNLDIRDEITQQRNGNDRHAITWLLSNTFHDLKEITLEVDIFGETTFERESLSVPAGDIEYDEQEKKLRWIIPQMPTSVDVLALQFTLTRLERNASQTQLMSKVTVRAKDESTGGDIFLIGDEILLDE